REIKIRPVSDPSKEQHESCQGAAPCHPSVRTPMDKNAARAARNWQSAKTDDRYLTDRGVLVIRRYDHENEFADELVPMLDLHSGVQSYLIYKSSLEQDGYEQAPDTIRPPVSTGTPKAPRLAEKN